MFPSEGDPTLPFVAKADAAPVVTPVVPVAPVAPLVPVTSFWSRVLAFLLPLFGTVAKTVVGWLAPADYIQLLAKIGVVLAGNLALWFVGWFSVATATVVAGLVILLTQILTGVFPGVFKSVPPTHLAD